MGIENTMNGVNETAGSENSDGNEGAATPAQQFSQLEAAIAEKRAGLATAPTEQLSSLVAEISEMEASRNKLLDAAHDEGTAENAQMDQERAQALQAQEAEEAASLAAVKERLGMNESTVAPESTSTAEFVTLLEGLSFDGGPVSPEVYALAHERLGLDTHSQERSLPEMVKRDESIKEEIGKMRAEALAQVQAMDASEQEALAEAVHSKSMSMGNRSRSDALRLYVSLKGTAFATKFKEVEDARLVAAGYAPLSL